MNLYVTSDKIGKANHGAGAVTFNESEVLKTFGPCEVWGCDEFSNKRIIGILDPWHDDTAASCKKDFFVNPPKLAHFYAGTFSKTIDVLHRNGSKITYTAAAHSIEASRKAHEELGIPYNYPHLTDPELWKQYVRGYLAADVLIVPSMHSANVMRSFGATRRTTPLSLSF